MINSLSRRLNRKQLNLFIEHNVIMFALPLDKSLDDVKQLRRDGLEVFMEVPFDSQRSKDVIVD